MIRLYCRRAESNRELCPSCRDLFNYALSRLEHCPYGENKPVCKNVLFIAISRSTSKK